MTLPKVQTAVLYQNKTLELPQGRRLGVFYRENSKVSQMAGKILAFCYVNEAVTSEAAPL